MRAEPGGLLLDVLFWGGVDSISIGALCWVQARPASVRADACMARFTRPGVWICGAVVMAFYTSAEVARSGGG